MTCNEDTIADSGFAPARSRQIAVERDHLNSSRLAQPVTNGVSIVEENYFGAEAILKKLPHLLDAPRIVFEHDDSHISPGLDDRYRINVALRSGPTLTILIGTPINCSIRFTYCCASGGSSSNLRQAEMFPRQPGRVS